MRREMDELFGDVLSPSRRGGFTPAVDVYYAADPPRAVVQADLAGIDPAHVALEVRGRELVIAGRRLPAPRDEQRVYQQLEIGSGAFRRVVALGADVDEERTHATYEDGMLVVELPIAAPADPRTVPIEPGRRE
jgi:HSP20 family protein